MDYNHSGENPTKQIATIEYTNVIIHKILALDDAFTQVGAFFYLQREISELANEVDINGAHAEIMQTVRASALRSAIAGIMACLDVQDQKNRRNRAGVGEISSLLQAKDFSRVFIHMDSAELSRQIGNIGTAFEELRHCESYKTARDLRDSALAHILIKDDSPKKLEYSEMTNLYDNTALLIDELYCIAGLSTPRFRSYEDNHMINALKFTSTYKIGIETQSKLHCTNDTPT
jgi:hypothetical protein